MTLDLIAVEQGDIGLAIALDALGVARHQHPHVFLGGLVGLHPVDEDFLHIPGVEVADGALDQARVLIDQGRRDRVEGPFAHVVPGTAQILEIALDFRLAPFGAGGPHDDAHAVLDLEIFDDLLELAPLIRVGDLARDTAAARGVGHQDAVASGEGDVTGQSGPLVAALFLDHLDQDDLVPLDDFLDLVAPRPAAPRPGFGGAVAVAVTALAPPAAPARGREALPPGPIFAVLGLGSVFRPLGGGGVGLRLAVCLRRIRRIQRILRSTGVRGRDIRYRRAGVLGDRGVGLVLDRFGFIAIRPVGVGHLLHRAVDLVDQRLGDELVPALRVLGGDQRFAVLDRDLEVVGVNVVERQEAMPVAAEIDECRLQGRLDPGDFG